MPEPPPAPSVRRRLRAARRRWATAETARGALVVVGVVGTAFLAAVAVEALAWLGVGLRTALFWLLAALLAALVAGLVLPPVLRAARLLPGMGDADVARRADADHPGIGDRILALLDLSRDADGSPLQAAAVSGLDREVGAVPFEAVEDRGALARAAPLALVPLLGFALALAVAPGPFEAAAGRLLSPGEAFFPPAAFSVAVEPGDVELVRGDSLAITARPEGRDWPETATVEVRREGERAVAETRVRLGADGAWSLTTGPADETFEYRVRAAGTGTPWYTARVVARPLVRGLRLTVQPPAYAGRPARRLAEGVGDVTALVGSAVRVVVGTAGEPAASGWLDVRWEDGRRARVPLRLGSEGGVATLRLRGPGTYAVRLQTAAGVGNAAPARYSIGTLGDGPPQITLVEGAEAPLDGTARRFAFQISDDFGFSGGSLVWRVVRGDARGRARRAALPVRTRPLGQSVAVSWRPAGVRPGDTVELFGEVRDNGPARQAARTPIVTLRFPSLAQAIAERSARRDSTRDALGQLRDDADEAAERFERFRRDLRQTAQPDWEDRRQVEALRERQADLSRQADAMRERMRQLQDDLRQSGTADDQTERMMDQMQRVMEELVAPELQEALQQLQEAMERLDMRQMNQQADNVEQAEQRFQDRLERAMELLERLEVAIELDEAAALAEDLAEREEALAEQTAELREEAESRDPDESAEPNDGDPASEQAESPRQSEQADGEQADGESEPSDPSERGDTQDGDPQAGEPDGADRPPSAEELAEQQRQNQADAEALEQQMQEILERMESMRGSPPGEMQDAQQQMRQDGGLPQQMQENADQLEQQQLQDAEQGQRDMARRLRRMQQQMQQAGQQMQGKRNQIDKARLRAALEDVLTLSREQERLGEETGALRSRMPALRPLARRQAELRTGLEHVRDSLRSIAKTVPPLGRAVQERTDEALREMNAAVQQLAEQRAPQSAARQKAAMTHLNSLAVLLADALRDAQNSSSSGSGGGSSGPPQQLQQMGEGQQRLNQQIQQMLNETAGQRLSRDAQTRLRQAAEQQEAIRRQLNQLLRDGSGGGAGGMSDEMRSALRRIEEQMGEAAQELRRGRITTGTLPRQQAIQQKLLQAERAANEQGQEEKREGETARSASPPPPGRVPAQAPLTDRVRADLLRALESGFSADYQDLIKSYFQRLQERAGG